MDKKFAVVLFISVSITMGGTAAAIMTGFNPFDIDDNSTIPTPEPTPDFYYNGTCGCYYIRR